MEDRNTTNSFLTYIPLVVWKFGVALVTFGIVLSFVAVGYYHHASFQDFFTSGLDVFFTILKWFVGMLIPGLIYMGYRVYHDHRLKTFERTIASEQAKKAALQNRLLEAKVQATEQLPVIMKYAMEQGHNVKYGGLEVTNYLSNVHSLGGSTEVREIAAPVQSQEYIPEPYTMSDVLQNWQPSKDGILLAKKQELITVPIGESLCHTTFTSATDGGKTNNERMLLIQLASLGQCIYLCDRNYQPFREDKKLGTWYDYRPIEAQLAHEPIVDTKQAVALLKFLYSIVEDRRTERRKVQTANAIVPFEDKYLFFDELPAFASEDREVMILLGRLLREARQYGVFVIAASQDLLNQTLNNDNGAIRDNLLTNFYGGGDSTTARFVLNLAKGQTIDETGLGIQGVTYLRAKGARIERIKARTPLSDNNATMMLLGDRQTKNKEALPDWTIESIPQTQPLHEQIGHTQLTGDLKRVYDACKELRAIDYKPSARNIELRTGIDKDKANNLLNRLEAMGYLDREKGLVYTEQSSAIV